MSAQEEPRNVSADISVEQALTEAETERIYTGLLANDPTPRRYDALILGLRTPDGQLVGALLAATVWNWLSIDILVALEDQLRSAQLTADVSVLDRLISDRLLFTGPDGQLGTKAQDLEAHGSGVVRFALTSLRNFTSGVSGRTLPSPRCARDSSWR